MTSSAAPIGLWLPALLLGLLVAAVLSGGLVWLLIRLTRGMAEAGTGFFAALARHDAGAARAFLSDAFLAATDAAALHDWQVRHGLIEVRGTTWFGRKRMTGRGLLHGQVHTTHGRAVAMRVGLVKQDGGWKIYSLHAVGGPLGAFLTPGWQRHPGATP
ncbi:SnoaL-like domain-containing protein [Pseudoxanthomonas sp. GM95]|uniref:nuclear transport factor 2 family protein n=1 Tax=Pseudoxanthomonas sp. GM95 TaxID=1881043 RepID=UPI0008B8FADD|nr:nuclear transport factor 2 family protein [Pseudoxanthomonas sp. GM95]SEL68192.1 SnoaL-like domain-containing protein [Pseudoxanthomonas sp. GM95]